MKIKSSFLLAALLFYGVPQAQTGEFNDPRILSFEDSALPLSPGKDSRLDLSGEHYKHGTHAARWDWTRDGAQIVLDAPVEYLAQNPNPKETSVSSFVFWVYAAQPLTGSLRFEFLKQGRTCAWFDYKLGFSGWRGAWVAFDRDMQGTPEEGMDRVVVTVHGAKRGSLWLDHWIAASFQDSRQHTADFQAPFINKNTGSHWLILLRSWENPLPEVMQKNITPAQRTGIDSIDKRLTRVLLQGGKPAPLKDLRRLFAAYGITENADGTLRGKPIYFIRYGETYINLGDNYAGRSKALHQSGQLLSQCNDLLYRIAVSYHASTDEAVRRELSAMYITLTRHLLDQGFEAGSALGTLHHLGYSMRNFYTAPVLMREALREAGLTERVQRAMEWFSGVGEVKLTPDFPGIDIDAFNTSLIGRLASILLLPDTPEKAVWLNVFSRWADNGFKYAPGTAPCFKSDGTLFHHRHHYPAYAIGGFDGSVHAIWLLHGTPFAISRESHENQKRALLEMRFYCNPGSFPLALSGRHPDGKGALVPWQYALLAEAGTPDGSSPVDQELACAYMRVASSEEAAYKRFAALGIAPESAPDGCRVYGYNASLSQRRGDWLLTAAGHSRYVWSAEIYNSANHYGRYLTHGSLQLLNEGGSFASGFSQEGWDWRRIPGTTAAVIPMAQMKADIRNVDSFSGYEEMLLSDETFAGGVSHQGRNGAFGMILHEHDKYNGSLRARKSMLFFDDRVVALGSGIENARPDCRVTTTLFQNHLAQTTDPIHVGDNAVTAFPYEKTMQGGVLRDNLGTAYFIARGNVHVTRSRQHSLHEETDAPTQGDFTTAWIDHGDRIADGEYEYMLVVNPSRERMAEYAAKLPYRVIEQSPRAHIVHDRPTQTTGYVLFEAGEVKDELLTQVSLPSLVMIGVGQDALTLSVCDPDLRFYKGPNDDIQDANGKRVERSIYSRKWIDNPSQASLLTLTLKGRWAPADSTSVHEVAYRDANTLVTFECREGATREAKFTRIP